MKLLELLILAFLIFITSRSAANELMKDPPPENNSFMPKKNKKQ